MPALSIPLPTAFTPVAAIQCYQASKVIPGRGQWLVAVEQRADHGLGPLVAALRRPSVVTPGNAICPAVGFVQPSFVLVDRGGRAVRPKIPTGICGQPEQQVLAALRGLPWTTVSTRLVQQVETQAEIDSGCPPAAKDMISMLAGRLHPPAAGAAPGTLASGTRASVPPAIGVCVFRIGSEPLVGEFVRGGHVTGAAAATLWRGITAGRGSAGCSRPHAMFAVLQPATSAGQVAYVEIDGCQRAVRPDYSVGEASPAAIAIINRTG